MDTSTPCRAAETAAEPTAPGRLWRGVVNALAIELAVVLLVSFLVGTLPC